MNASPKEVGLHDDVTRTVLVGLISMAQERRTDAASSLADEIMSLFKKRGYRPHIKHANCVRDGKKWRWV